jgi:hypothetical protein
MAEHSRSNRKVSVASGPPFRSAEPNRWQNSIRRMSGNAQRWTYRYAIISKFNANFKANFKKNASILIFLKILLENQQKFLILQ